MIVAAPREPGCSTAPSQPSQSITTSERLPASAARSSLVAMRAIRSTTRLAAATARAAPLAGVGLERVHGGAGTAACQADRVIAIGGADVDDRVRLGADRILERAVELALVDAQQLGISEMADASG